MLRLGVTGGIGSGKTTVCRIFEQLGVPVYYADKRAADLVEQNLQLREDIIHYFGSKAFNNGHYNRPYIASVVFSDKVKLDLLNSLIHPYVFSDWEAFCRQHAGKPYVVKEAAIMLETESRKTVDKVVLVYAPEELRIQRTMERDHTNKEAVLARIKSQMPEEDKLKLADAVIYNNGERPLIPQVLELHRQII